MASTDLRDFPRHAPLTGLPAWQALLRHLSLASGPDFLFLITPDAYGARACRRELEKSRPPHSGPLILLEPDVPNDPAELLTCMEAAIGKPGQTLFWIELPVEVPYEFIPDAQAAWDRAFAALNPHRNHILQELPGPLIFAGPPWLFRSFRYHAPDWFSVRAGVFDLPHDIEQLMIAYLPLLVEDGTQLDPIPEVEFPNPEFAPGLPPPSAEELENLLHALPAPELTLLQTLGWLDAAHPVPVWLLASHPDLPYHAEVPETLDSLINRGLLIRSLDARWLRLPPAVMRAAANTIPEPATSHSSFDNAFEMFGNANLGSPQDVRSWPKWNPLQPHAVSLCEHAPDETAPQFLTWLLGKLNHLFYAKGLHAEAVKYSRRALKIDRAVLGDDDPEVATDLNNLAVLLQETNRPTEAEPLIRAALRIDRAAFGDEHPEVATDLNNLAQLLQETNRLAEAEPLMRDALRIDRAAYGDGHPKVAVRLNNLAQLLQSTNRLTEAEPLMRDALRIDRAAFGDEHPNVAIRLNNLAALLQETNRLAEAEPLMRDALRIDRAAFGDEHPNVAIRLNNLAALLQETNRLAEAEPLMRDALRIDRAAFGEYHPKVAIRLNNLATLLQATNRLAEAEPLLRDALRICNASLGPKHPGTINISRNLELLQAEMGGGE